MLNPNQFSPPWYLRSGHLQTILTGFHKPKAELPQAKVHRIGIESVGDILVYENSPEQIGKQKTKSEAVFLFHGLASSHRGSYMTYMASGLLEQGYRIFRFDLPGAGDSYEYTSLPPHGACSNHLWTALVELNRRLQIDCWRGMGVSLGGNLLLRLLIDHAEELHPSDGSSPSLNINKAVAIAPPIDLAACSRLMDFGLKKIYSRYFLRALKHQTKARAERWPSWRERLNVAGFRSIQEFDSTVTAPLAGFASAEDYYQAGSTIGQLEAIRTPCTILIDEHDPIVPYSLFRDAKLSSSTQLQVTRRGGHIGYLCKNPKKDAPHFIRWSDAWGISELASIG